MREKAAIKEKQAVEYFLFTRTEGAFCSLFEAFYPKVRNYFLVRGLDAATAEELTQNVLLTVYQRVGDLRGQELFYGWLFEIARNEMLMHIRRRDRGRNLVSFEPLSAELAATLAAETYSYQQSSFYEWVTHLEPEEREIIMLRFVDDLSYEEISVALGVPMGTVKWRIFNAKKKLSKIIPSRAEGR